jgi:hypothetical protein
MENIVVKKSIEPSVMWLVRGHTGKWEDYTMWNVGVFFHEIQAQTCCDFLNKLYKDGDTKTLTKYDSDFYQLDNYVSYDVKPVPLKIWGTNALP